MKHIASIISLAVAGMSLAQVEVYNEDFESGAPIDYTLVDNDGNTPNAAVSEFTEAWIRLADPDNPSDTVMGSTSYFDPVGEADRWLITPALNLGTYGNILYWEARSHDPSFPDDYYILISITDTQLSSFIDTVGYIQQENADWTSRSTNLSSYGYNNQPVHLAFVNRTDDGFKLYVDDIRLEIEDPVGISEISPLNVQIYPNPTVDEVNIKAPENSEIVCTSLDGKSVYSGTNQHISTTGWESGIYFVTVLSGNQSVTYRVIKQ